jgi:hypothetical protein
MKSRLLVVAYCQLSGNRFEVAEKPTSALVWSRAEIELCGGERQKNSSLSLFPARTGSALGSFTFCQSICPYFRHGYAVLLL